LPSIPHSHGTSCLSPSPHPHSQGGPQVPHLWSHVCLGHDRESWWTSSPLCPGKPPLLSERGVLSSECSSALIPSPPFFPSLFSITTHMPHVCAHTLSLTVPALSPSVVPFPRYSLDPLDTLHPSCLTSRTILLDVWVN
jgi:hypothetical protein